MPGTFDVGVALHACGAATDWAMEQCQANQAAFIVSPCCIGKVQQAWKNISPVPMTSPVALPKGQCSTANGVVASAVNNAQLHQVAHPRSSWMRACLKALIPARLGTGRHNTGSTSANTESTMEKGTGQGNTAITSLTNQMSSGSSSRSSEAIVLEYEDLQLQPMQDGAEDTDSQLQLLYVRLARAADYSHQEQHGYFDLAARAKSNLELDRSRRMEERGYQSWLVRLLQPELTAKSDVIVGIPSLQDNPIDAARPAVL